ncbi:MAG: peptide deformylase [Candidatus Nomurabacteria bacterium]
MVKIVQIDWKKEDEEQKLDETSVLRHEAKNVNKNEFGTPELKKILDDMKEAMNQESDGVAIAAPQIGISKKIFLVRESAYEIGNKNPVWKPLVFINPTITKASKKTMLADEGCLSVRPLYGTTERHASVTIEAYDFMGNKFSFGASNLIAQIFQHECDHLDGILFIDHAENIQEIEIEKHGK